MFSSTYGHKPCLQFFLCLPDFCHHHVCVFCRSFARGLLNHFILHGFASTVPLALSFFWRSLVLNLLRSLLCRNGYGHQTWWSPWRRPPFSRAFITFHTQRRKRGQPCVKLATSRTLKERWEPHPNKSSPKPRPNGHEPWAIAAAPHHTKTTRTSTRSVVVTHKNKTNTARVWLFNLNIHHYVARNLKNNHPFTKSGRVTLVGTNTHLAHLSVYFVELPFAQILQLVLPPSELRDSCPTCDFIV